MRKAGFVPSSHNGESLHTPPRWIRAYLVVGAFLAAGVATLTMAGGNSVRSEPAASSTYTATAKGIERSGTQAAYRLVY